MFKFLRFLCIIIFLLVEIIWGVLSVFNLLIKFFLNILKLSLLSSLKIFFMFKFIFLLMIIFVFNIFNFKVSFNFCVKEFLLFFIKLIKIKCCMFLF